jgi:hypothetical protein
MSTGITLAASARLTGGDGLSLSGSAAASGDTVTSIDAVIPLNTTNSPVAAAFLVADVVALYIVSDQNVTLKTNSTGSPANTIALKAGIPLVWVAAAPYQANPFTTDVTAFFITNTAAARFQALILTS